LTDYLEKPALGFLLGKFLPPHKGHDYLIQFAKNYCKELIVAVCTLEREPIPGELRFEWVREMAGHGVTVIWVNENLPQYPEEAPDTFWDTWQRIVRESCKKHFYTGQDGLGGPYWKYPDVVFASEDYGHKLAEVCNARFVPVDPDRSVVPISATKIRSDPRKFWQYLPAPVRPYYAKRVCVFGPESTGKTTLAKQLAGHFRTAMVTEYGRTYTEAFGSDVGAQDLQYIVQGHLASVQAAKREASQCGFVIEDTDPVMTAVWSTMLTGQRDVWFDQYTDHADLYLLCDVDIPWVDDGTRYFKEEEDRKRFFQECKDELDRRGVEYRIISNPSAIVRFKSAVKHIMDWQANCFS
jgi:HTH-type transcriptional repressor of NAD biosynthesis genes